MFKLDNSIQSFLDNSELSFSSYSSLALLLSQITDKKIIIITPNEKKAKKLYKILKSILPSDKRKIVSLIQAWDSSPFLNSSPSIASQGKRISTLIEAKTSKYIITSVSSYIQKFYIDKTFKTIKINTKTLIDLEDFIDILIKNAYSVSNDTIEHGEYSTRGNILDFFPPHLDNPVRIEFYGDSIERISLFNKDTGRSIQQIEEIKIYPTRELILEKIKNKDNLFLDKITKTKSHERLKIAKLLAENTYIPNIEFLSWIFLKLENLKTILKPNLTLSIDSNNFYTEDLEEDLNLFGEIKISPLPLYDTSLLHNIDKRIFTNSYVEDIEGNTVISKTISIDKNNSKDIQELLISGKRVIVNANKNKLKDINASIENTLNTQKYISEIINTPLNGKIELSIGNLETDFMFNMDRLLIISKHTKERPKQEKTNKSPYKTNIEEGDYIIHKEHGIGIFKGFKTIKTHTGEADFIHIQYAGTDKLFVSTDQIYNIKKYKPKNLNIKLDKLGSKSWEIRKKRAKKGAEKLAKELLEIHAKRASQQGFALYNTDETLSEELDASFPYTETVDQLKALNDTFKDMESSKPMDRIICGDVGFGKTEIAIRAMFRAVLNNKQVAFLVPTTLLAMQHEKTLKKRFKNFSITIEAIARFKTPKEQKETKEKLSQGKIDIIVGTHALLSKSIKFKNLALLIIDEEHKFGVSHKEKIKSLAPNIDILTLSATPIPRTLNLAISGIKEISFLKTPPENRLPIRTIILKDSQDNIERAISNEVSRGGQVFFLHNRARELEKIRENLKKIFPNLRIGIAHGQLTTTDLEKTVIDFYKQKIDILVCTSIIESGLDIPNANTLIINRADLLGLSQLHQIRGRIGRSNKKAFCYLLLPNSFNFSKQSIERINIFQKFSELGAGFAISNYDLELRGAGEFLGSNQSGFIEDVGMEEYISMVKDEIKNIKGEKNKKIQTKIKIPKLNSFIPQTYIPSIRERIDVYKEISNLESQNEITNLKQALGDKYGKIPNEVKALLLISELRVIAQELNINELNIKDNNILMEIEDSKKLDIDKLTILSKETKLKLIPPNKIKYPINDTSIKNIIEELKNFVKLVKL